MGSNPAQHVYTAVYFPRVFLAEQFEFLQPHLDAVMPAVKKPFLQQFYSQVRDALVYHFNFEQYGTVTDYLHWFCFVCLLVYFFTRDQPLSPRRTGQNIQLFTHLFIHSHSYVKYLLSTHVTFSLVRESQLKLYYLFMLELLFQFYFWIIHCYCIEIQPNINYNYYKLC